jgi:putative ABC transport system substrate-binding protein
VKRRDFITLLGGAAVTLPLAARAQQSTGQPLVGLLSPLSAAAWVHILGAFRRGMRDLGYVEGANVAFTFRFAEGQVAKLPALVNELVALKPAVIAVGSPAAVLETHKATRTIPIVMATSQDPTAVGLAASLARPGGNVTGFWTEGDEALIGKQLDLLKHAVPGIARIGVMVNPDDAADARSLKALPAAPGCPDRAPKRGPPTLAAEVSAKPVRCQKALPESLCSVRLHRQRPLPQSSSASRFTAGAAGFFILRQSGDRPDR